MSNIDRITDLAQDIYLARHNQRNDVEGTDLEDFLDQTINWVNQLIPEVEKEADWNFSRTNNDDSIGAIADEGTISYPLPSNIRKLVINPHRDLTIQQDGTVISTFKLVNPNQVSDPTEPYDYRDRATVIQRKVVFSRKLKDVEVGGSIVADTIAPIPRLSQTDTSLLDILDDNYDIRQLFVLGVLKNQVLPDIVQGGLSPSFAQKYNDLLTKCVAENNLSADTDDADRESFGYVGGIW